MSELAIYPMQWAKIADLHDTPRLGDSDLACMAEVRAVLQKHDKLDRFALHLIHKHFDLDQDEILVEYSEHDTREQYFRVEKATPDILTNSIPTTWTLHNIEPLANCVCAYRTNEGHLGRHETG
ncbi:MAG TPA: hypothetical protein VEI06_08605 [Gemmatimonadaceae bacterium]|nr:hypothetical protein [Gemmatimonadaceae bacterium]